MAHLKNEECSAPHWSALTEKMPLCKVDHLIANITTLEAFLFCCVNGYNLIGASVHNKNKKKSACCLPSQDLVRSKLDDKVPQQN